MELPFRVAVLRRMLCAPANTAGHTHHGPSGTSLPSSARKLLTGSCASSPRPLPLTAPGQRQTPATPAAPLRGSTACLHADHDLSVLTGDHRRVINRPDRRATCALITDQRHSLSDPTPWPGASMDRSSNRAPSLGGPRPWGLGLARVSGRLSAASGRAPRGGRVRSAGPKSRGRTAGWGAGCPAAVRRFPTVVRSRWHM